ncbi:AraC family transcriptional regulator [Olivibacter sp. SDN3]|uniref:helix-turn-helix domain-containing protein n=1 Tax=Olivibacter sp. SDN3 TaxID=2764720 RepID=UPI001651A838|nr:helix-turn-helix domain-containing protein [Olivibacter sp. SDN3]QNL51064.1 AraC family transcriptional regulator [Olivibacter sp. SDN3]
MEKLVNADEFVERFMVGNMDHLRYKHSPVKVFRLIDIAPYLKIPIPPILFGYNLLIHLTEGYFEHQVGPKVYVVNAPAVLMSTYGNISAIKSVDTSAKGHCVLINDSAMTSIFREQEILNIFTISPLLNLSKDVSDGINQLFRMLYEELHTSDPYKELTESLLKSLLLKIIKLSASNRVLSRTQEIAMLFKQLVHKHCRKQKHIGFYTDKLAVSANYLNRCVSTVYNKSSKQLILEVLVMHAQLMLFESSNSVSDICYELDFPDPSYFSRVFKKLVGMSPTDYRYTTRQ